MKVINLFLISGILLLTNGLSLAEAGKGLPGDEFRRTAADYEDNAAKAVKEATNTRGENVSRYLELSSIYREMAQIKRRAAKLADQGKWNDVKWERYHQLESRRDQLLGQVNWSHTRKQAASKKGKDNSGLSSAAKEYERQAEEARREAEHARGPVKSMYMELSGIYEEMAAIKYQAADERGQDFNWSKYKRLEYRRDKLKDQISRMAYR
jgi:hypothetical protein